MTLASDVLRHLQWLLAKVVGPVILLMLLLLTSCNQAPQPEAEVKGSEKVTTPAFFAPRPALKQVETPALIQELSPWLDTYSPQVQIRQPKAEEVFETNTVRVNLRVQDLPIYKDETWEMGPHLEILLDNQPYGSIYDIDQPIILENLSPGTHTLRVFAERPWHESFKNEGSYAQVTFHVFAKTGENAPAPNQPLLTYGSPEGAYGAEPVLLDFYLTDAPLHQVAQDNPAISDWRVRYTLNGDSLTLKDWRPIYIEGLKPGKNWIQLTLVDEEDNPLEGVFNNTVRLIDYDPDLDNTLAKIVGGDLTLEEVGRIIDPTYEPPVIEPPAPPMTETPTETPVAPEPNEGDELEKQLDTQASPNEVIEPEIIQTRAPEISEPEISEPEVKAPEVKAPEVGESDLSDTAKESLETTIDSIADDNPIAPSGSLEIDSSDTSSSKPKLPDNGEIPAVNKITPSETPANIQLEDSELATEKPETADTSTSGEGDSDLPVDIITNVESEPLSSANSNSESNLGTTDSKNDVEEVSPSKRKYFQRLYDYRERSMKTYGQDRGQ